MKRQDALPEVNGEEEVKKAKYSNYEVVELQLRLVDRALGAAPQVKEKNQCKFERIGNKIVLRAKNFKALTRSCLVLANLDLPKVAIQNFFFEDSFPVKANMGQLVLPSPPQGKGMRGTGLCVYETLEPGSVIKMRAHIPTSQVTRKQFVEAIKLGGLTVRFSPAKSHLGYGAYEVLK